MYLVKGRILLEFDGVPVDAESEAEAAYKLKELYTWGELLEYETFETIEVEEVRSGDV